MPEQREDPEKLSDLKALDITQELKDFVKGISQVSDEEKNNRAWWDAQIDKYISLRYGLRPVKNHPWPNCANYVIPQIDSDINRLKPSYVNLINVTPIVSFEGYGPEDQEPARKRECLFDWRMRTKVDFFQTYVLGIDHMLEQGCVVFKVSWKYSTRNYIKLIDLNDFPQEVISALFDPMVTDEILSKIIVEQMMIDTTFEENVEEIDRVVKKFREGESSFELNLVEEKDNQPEVVAVNVREDLVIPVNCVDIHEAPFIDYKFPMCKNDIKIAMRDERYEKHSDDQIDSWITGAPLDKTRRYPIISPITRKNTDEILVHEVCCWYDINDDGIEEKCIVTYPDADPTAILRFIELPYNHGQWPYNLVKREINDCGMYSSRSIGQLDEDFQNGLSAAFNQSVDNGTITNTPTIVARRNSVQNLKNLKFVPGQTVETTGATTDYEVRQNVNASQGNLFAQAQYLKSWADQRIGNITSGLTSPLNMPGTGQAGNKTKKEIDVIETLQSETQSLDLQIFQDQMAWVYYQIDALYDQFGNDEEAVAITGQPAQRISRQEIQGKFNIVPNGKLNNSNPELRAQKSFMLLRAFLGDPDIRQEELKKMYLMDFDVKLLTRLMKTPEEKQAEMQAMMQQQEAMKQDYIQTQIGVRGQTDAMDIRKEAVLATIQGRKYAAD